MTDVGKLEKRISIDGSNQAYNGTILECPEGRLIIYRRNRSEPNTIGHDTIEYVAISKDYELEGRPRTLKLPGTFWEDPKALNFRGKLTVLVGGPRTNPLDWRSRSVFQVECDYQRRLLKPCVPRAMSAPGVSTRSEKNWVPFFLPGMSDMLILYSLSPLRVLRQTRAGNLVWMPSKGGFSDPVGRAVSCGTQPVEISPGRFLTINHSVEFPYRALEKCRGLEERILSHTRLYYMSASIFHFDDIFVAESQSTDFIVYESIFDTHNPRVTRPETVLFPAFCELKDGRIWLLVSENDAIMKVVSFDLDSLLKGFEFCPRKNIPQVHDRPVPCSFGNE